MTDSLAEVLCEHGAVTLGEIEDDMNFGWVSLLQKRADLRTLHYAPNASTITMEAHAPFTQRQDLSLGTTASSAFSASSTSMISNDILLVSMIGACTFTVTLIILLSVWARDTSKGESKRHTVFYSVLSPHSHRIPARLFRWFIAIVVLIDVVAFLYQSNPDVGSKYAGLFHILEAISSWIFATEYLLRLYVIPESKRYIYMTETQARLWWIISLESIVDLLAFVPFFIEIISEVIYPGQGIDMPNLSWLRVFRLFRILKVTWVSESLDVFARVIYYNAQILIVAMILCFVLVLLLSTLLFYMQPKEVKNENFSSITACVYLAIMMLTGQGQPEGVLPWYTKLVVCITCIFAVGLFAIQASMLTWGFENEAERRVKDAAERKRKLVKAILDGNDVEENCSSSSSEDDVDSDWEDYEENIAGDSDEADLEDELEDDVKDETLISEQQDDTMRKMNQTFSRREVKTLLLIFKFLDKADDGMISLEELQALHDLNAQRLFEMLDTDADGYITKSELIDWFLRVKKHWGVEIFKKVLLDMLKACKARENEEKAKKEVVQAVEGITKISEGFKALQAENEKLRSENEKLRDELKKTIKQKEASPRRASVSGAPASS